MLLDKRNLRWRNFSAERLAVGCLVRLVSHVGQNDQVGLLQSLRRRSHRAPDERGDGAIHMRSKTINACSLLTGRHLDAARTGSL